MKKPLKPEKILEELESVAAKIFTQIRYEEGQFQSGACYIKGKKILILNKRQPLEEKIASLASVLSKQGLENIYLKPAIREELEKVNQTKVRPT